MSPRHPVQVSSQEALETARKLAKEEGLFVGISSGATGTAALKVRRASGARRSTALCCCRERAGSTAPDPARRPCQAPALRLDLNHTATSVAASLPPPCPAQVASRPENKGKLIVVVFASSGERYLSTKLFEALYEDSRDQEFEA